MRLKIKNNSWKCLSLSLSLSSAQSLLERLTHRIIFKLDDAALEIMCGLYARNHKLKLTPSDVQFLQPPGSTPSRQLRILVPLWVREIHALFFYFLQVSIQYFLFVYVYVCISRLTNISYGYIHTCAHATCHLSCCRRWL